MIRLKIFISSVQKELREERIAIGRFLVMDDFLRECTVPRIFEDYPQPLRPNPQRPPQGGDSRAIGHRTWYQIFFGQVNYFEERMTQRSVIGAVLERLEQEWSGELTEFPQRHRDESTSQKPDKTQQALAA